MPMKTAHGKINFNGSTCNDHTQVWIEKGKYTQPLIELITAKNFPPFLKTANSWTTLQDVRTSFLGPRPCSPPPPSLFLAGLLQALILSSGFLNGHQYPFIYLGIDKHFRVKVSCPKKQHKGVRWPIFHDLSQSYKSVALT